MKIIYHNGRVILAADKITNDQAAQIEMDYPGALVFNYPVAVEDVYQQLIRPKLLMDEIMHARKERSQHPDVKTHFHRFHQMVTAVAIANYKFQAEFEYCERQPSDEVGAEFANWFSAAKACLIIVTDENIDQYNRPLLVESQSWLERIVKEANVFDIAAKKIDVNYDEDYPEIPGSQEFVATLLDEWEAASKIRGSKGEGEKLNCWHKLLAYMQENDPASLDSLNRMVLTPEQLIEQGLTNSLILVDAYMTSLSIDGLLRTNEPRTDLIENIDVCRAIIDNILLEAQGADNAPPPDELIASCMGDIWNAYYEFLANNGVEEEQLAVFSAAGKHWQYTLIDDMIMSGKVCRLKLAKIAKNIAEHTEAAEEAMQAVDNFTQTIANTSGEALEDMHMFDVTDMIDKSLGNEGVDVDPNVGKPLRGESACYVHTDESPYANADTGTDDADVGTVDDEYWLMDRTSELDAMMSTGDNTLEETVDSSVGLETGILPGFYEKQCAVSLELHLPKDMRREKHYDIDNDLVTTDEVVLAPSDDVNWSAIAIDDGDETEGLVSAMSLDGDINNVGNWKYEPDVPKTHQENNLTDGNEDTTVHDFVTDSGDLTGSVCLPEDDVTRTTHVVEPDNLDSLPKNAVMTFFPIVCDRDELYAPLDLVPIQTVFVHGVQLSTRPLAFGDQVNMLACTTHPELIAKSYQDETDEIGVGVGAATIFVEIACPKHNISSVIALCGDLNVNPNVPVNSSEFGAVVTLDSTLISGNKISELFAAVGIEDALCFDSAVTVQQTIKDMPVYRADTIDSFTNTPGVPTFAFINPGFPKSLTVKMLGYFPCGTRKGF